MGFLLYPSSCLLWYNKAVMVKRGKGNKNRHWLPPKSAVGRVFPFYLQIEEIIYVPYKTVGGPLKQRANNRTRKILHKIKIGHAVGNSFSL